jgi:hypothetical protein
MDSLTLCTVGTHFTALLGLILAEHSHWNWGACIAPLFASPIRMLISPSARSLSAHVQGLIVAGNERHWSWGAYIIYTITRLTICMLILPRALSVHQV